MLKRVMKVALVQMAVGSEKKLNIAEAVSQIHSAKEKGASLVVLPECFNSPYGTQYFKEYAEEIPSGETCVALSKAARETGLCIVGGSLPERDGGRLYNTSTVWDTTGTLIAKHRKLHLFDIDIPDKITFKESEVLTAGDKITTFKFNGVTIGIGICYDLRFYEMAHIMAELGCSMLIYPAAFNMITGPAHWEILGQARAIDNQLYVALVSPARDTKASYCAWGYTTMFDPWGDIIGTLDHAPGVVMATVDFNKVGKIRASIPIREQRRNDVYQTRLNNKM